MGILNLFKKKRAAKGTSVDGLPPLPKPVDVPDTSSSQNTSGQTDIALDDALSEKQLDTPVMKSMDDMTSGATQMPQDAFSDDDFSDLEKSTLDDLDADLSSESDFSKDDDVASEESASSQDAVGENSEESTMTENDDSFLDENASTPDADALASEDLAALETTPDGTMKNEENDALSLKDEESSPTDTSSTDLTASTDATEVSNSEAPLTEADLPSDFDVPEELASVPEDLFINKEAYINLLGNLNILKKQLEERPPSSDTQETQDVLQESMKQTLAAEGIMTNIEQQLSFQGD